MQNSSFHKEHLRGSSSLKETEKSPHESLTLPVLKRRNQPKELPMDSFKSALDGGGAW